MTSMLQVWGISMRIAMRIFQRSSIGIAMTLSTYMDFICEMLQAYRIVDLYMIWQFGYSNTPDITRGVREVFWVWDRRCSLIKHWSRLLFLNHVRVFPYHICNYSLKTNFTSVSEHPGPWLWTKTNNASCHVTLLPCWRGHILKCIHPLIFREDIKKVCMNSQNGDISIQLYKH